MPADSFRQVEPLAGRPSLQAHPAKPGLWKLVQLFIGLAQRKGHATIQVQVRHGQIDIVHVSQSFRLEDLPVAVDERANLGLGLDDAALVEALRANA
jgi:hypothetical protein